MMNTESGRWSRVKGRLKAEVGDDIFSSWFARMDLEAVENETVTAFGADAISQELDPVALQRSRAALLAGRRRQVQRIELTVRSAVLRSNTAKPKTGDGGSAARRAKLAAATAMNCARVAAPVSAAHEALGGSPLDPRLTFESFVVGRSNTLAHAAAKQVAARAAATS